LRLNGGAARVCASGEKGGDDHFLRIPIGKIFLPITHDFVHASAVDHARKAAHMLYEVTNDHGIWRSHFKVVDVAVERLHHSKDEFCYGPKSPRQAEFPSFTI